MLFTKEALVSLIAIVLPLFYVLVYGHSPILGLLSRKMRAHGFFRPLGASGADGDSFSDGGEPEDVRSQLLANLERTREEFREAYRRARIHLGVAVVLAMLGPLSIFSWEFAMESNPGAIFSHAAEDHEFWYAVPRLSMFIFLEVMAGFFMGQYRRAMEQHRHYEGVLREREAQFVAYLLLSGNQTGDPDDLRHFARELLYLEMIDLSPATRGADEPIGRLDAFQRMFASMMDMIDRRSGRHGRQSADGSGEASK